MGSAGSPPRRGGRLRQAGGGRGGRGGTGRRRRGFLLALRQGQGGRGPGAGHATWRRFTVVAPAGVVGVGDPLAAERLALLRCLPWLLAVPVRAQQLSLASSCCRAEGRAPIGQGTSGPGWLGTALGFWSGRTHATGTAWESLCLIHHHAQRPPAPEVNDPVHGPLHCFPSGLAIARPSTANTTHVRPDESCHP